MATTRMITVTAATTISPVGVFFRMIFTSAVWPSFTEKSVSRSPERVSRMFPPASRTATTRSRYFPGGSWLTPHSPASERWRKVSLPRLSRLNSSMRVPAASVRRAFAASASANTRTSTPAPSVVPSDADVDVRRETAGEREEQQDGRQRRRQPGRQEGRGFAERTALNVA